MTILVTGSIGNIGPQVVTLLAGNNVRIRAFTRSPRKAHFPSGVTPVTGELSDVEAMRGALPASARCSCWRPTCRTS